MPGTIVDHLRHVVGVGEVRRRTDRLPRPLLALEDRRDREPERGKRERRHGDRAGAVGGEVHQPPAGDRLALERAGHAPVERVLRLRFPCGGRARTPRVPYGELRLRQRTATGAKRSSPRHPVRAGLTTSIRTSQARASRLATNRTSGCEQGFRRARIVSSRTRLGLGVGVGRAPSDRDGPRLPDRPRELAIGAGVRLRGERDHVGELGHGVEVAERGQPRQPERVQLVAQQQRQVDVLASDDQRLAVVERGSPRGSSPAAARTRARGRGPGGRRPRAAAGPGRSSGALARRWRAGRARCATVPPCSVSASCSACAPSRAVLISRRSPRTPRPAASTVRSTSARACGRATGTRPRTARRAGTRRAPAARGTRRRRRRCRMRQRPRSRRRGWLGEEHGQQARDALDLDRPRSRRPRASRRPSASAFGGLGELLVGGARPACGASASAAATASGFPDSVPAW